MPTVWITNKKEQEEIIQNCDSCALSMVDNGRPYVVIMNFGYKNETLYFHGDPEGRKMDVLRKNPQVCITMSTGHSLYHRDDHVACSYGMNYKSIVADGTIAFVENYKEKIEALDIIMKQYVKRDFKYNEPAIKQVCIFKVKLTHLKAKNFGRFIR